MHDLDIRPRLVIVEDDQDSLEALAVFLAGKYEVFGYQSPTEALKAVPSIKPDVLLLDIGTAPIDGVDCLKRIRAMTGFPDIPAVAFTGYARDVERQRFMTAGFQAVVVKPALNPQEDLVAVIDRVLACRAASRHTAGDVQTTGRSAGRLSA